MPLIVVQPLKREEAGQFIYFFASRCKAKSFALKLVCKSEAEASPTERTTSVTIEVRQTCKNAVSEIASASEPRVRSVNEERDVTKPRVMDSIISIFINFSYVNVGSLLLCKTALHHCQSSFII